MSKSSEFPFDDDLTCGAFWDGNCDQPGDNVVVVGNGGMLGKLCDKHTEELELELQRGWRPNREMSLIALAFSKNGA